MPLAWPAWPLWAGSVLAAGAAAGGALQAVSQAAGHSYTLEVKSKAVLNGGGVSTAGQTYDGTVSLGSNTVLNAGSGTVTFKQAVGRVGGQDYNLEIQSAARFEFLKDFYFSVNGYGSFDSRPPAGRANSDVGMSLALGWSF